MMTASQLLRGIYIGGAETYSDAVNTLVQSPGLLGLPG